MMLFLATDLDGTLLGGSEDDKKQLYSWLTGNELCQLVFVTGRGLGTILPLFENSDFPKPDFIISDVGASVVHGRSYEQVVAITQTIDELWPGEDEIHLSLQDIGGLVKQNVPMHRRCSYYFNASTDLEMVYSRSKQMNVDVLLSAGKYLDVLPKDVNKGSTLQKLVNLLRVPPKEVVVAGDTLNDLSLFESGFKGIIVGGAEEELLRKAGALQNVYTAQSPGAGGILEGLNHYGFI